MKLTRLDIERVNLWTKWAEGHFIVIPTNIGWTPNRTVAIMGCGLAEQAAKRFPALKEWYGSVCYATRHMTPVIEFGSQRILMFPTKPLNRDAPELSYRQDASLPQIARSMMSLLWWLDLELEDQRSCEGDGGMTYDDNRFQDDTRIYMPMVGTGAGNLSVTDVVPLLLDILNNAAVPSVRRRFAFADMKKLEPQERKMK